MPTGNVDKPIIEDNRDGTVSIKYDPREEGLHELHVKYNGEHVQGKKQHSQPYFTLPHETLLQLLNLYFYIYLHWREM